MLFNDIENAWAARNKRVREAAASLSDAAHELRKAFVAKTQASDVIDDDGVGLLARRRPVEVVDTSGGEARVVRGQLQNDYFRAGAFDFALSVVLGYAWHAAELRIPLWVRMRDGAPQFAIYKAPEGTSETPDESQWIDGIDAAVDRVINTLIDHCNVDPEKPITTTGMGFLSDPANLKVV